ncbi:MAG: ribosomal protein S18-alanine N-acetyltransferase [Acidimicrobiales bacterium]|jgi:ribosomal-protein-alanine N-acetyltransferase
MGFRLPGLSRRHPEPAPAGVDIVPMKRRHLKDVVAIEQGIFPSPWSVSLYLSELTQPATRTYIVARADGEVIGYAGLMVAVGEGHVTTIGVSPHWQRRGIGRMLLMKLAQTAIERGAEALTLEVRVTNTGAQALYHEFGFAPAGIRKNYYAEVHEDAIVMWAHGIQGDDYAARLSRIEERLREAYPSGSTSAGPGDPSSALDGEPT